MPGTGKLLDTEHGVNVDVWSTGRFPGDDKPKPIAFPDPEPTAVRGQRIALLPMPRYIGLKLASGMVAPHRGKDLVDVQELIRSAALPASVADELHPCSSVRKREPRRGAAREIVNPDVTASQRSSGERRGM